MKTAVIIPAAGLGTRLNEDKPKQFLEIDNVPIIIKTIQLFDDVDEVESIVIPVHAEWVTYTKELVQQFNCQKVKDITIGGAERQESVSVAMRRPAIKESEIVLIHDSVRPFTSQKLINSLLETAEDCGAVIPILKPKDTIKEITYKGYVIKTLDREKLAIVQTPQAYWTSIAINAYEEAAKSGYRGTDTAALVEFIGCKVAYVEGEETNIKITTQLDLEYAK